MQVLVGCVTAKIGFALNLTSISKYVGKFVFGITVGIMLMHTHTCQTSHMSNCVIYRNKYPNIFHVESEWAFSTGRMRQWDSICRIIVV